MVQDDAPPRPRRTSSRRTWPLPTAAAIATASILFSAIHRHEETVVFMQETIAACVALCLFEAMGRGCKRPLLLLVVPVLVWATMPLWLGPAINTVGRPVGDCIPEVLYASLPSFDDVFLVAALISTAIATAVVLPAYAIATRSWQVAGLTIGGSLAAAVAITGIVHAQPPEFLAWPMMQTAIQAASIMPIGFWAVCWLPKVPGCCQSCGYDMAGLGRATCPECGRHAAVTPSR